MALHGIALCAAGSHRLHRAFGSVVSCVVFHDAVRDGI